MARDDDRAIAAAGHGDVHQGCRGDLQPALRLVPSSRRNRAVTHHAIVNVRDRSGTHRIGGYQPGGATTVYSKGIARLVPKGASLTLNMHYNPNGSAATDRTRIALVFARGPIDKVAVTAM